ncbi:MAG: Com family DNA-binding transcriptional regulator [Candidatus Margulisiibacteriota bacterium]
MRDFRCKQCNRLLARVGEGSKVEIKCPRCKTMNLYSEEVYITIQEEDKDTCTDPEVAES